jgi:Ubiquitin elongating factor core
VCRRPILIDFLKALLNDLSYLLDDSLARIADIESINAVQADAAQWGKLSQNERETRTNFKTGQVSCFCVSMWLLHRT